MVSVVTSVNKKTRTLTVDFENHKINDQKYTKEEFDEAINKIQREEFEFKKTESPEKTPLQTYTKESLHYDEIYTSIARPNISNPSVLKIKLFGACYNREWFLKYSKGERVLDFDVPLKWLHRTKERIWQYVYTFIHHYKTETEIRNTEEFAIIEDSLCDWPKIVIHYLDGSKKTETFKNWKDAEKRYKLLCKKFKLMKMP